MKYSSVVNDFIVNLDKEILRIDILKNIIKKYKVTLSDLLDSYKYKTTKFDPIVIYNISKNKIMNKEEYKSIISEINNIQDKFFNVKSQIKDGFVHISYKNITHKISQTNYTRIKGQIVNDNYVNFCTFDALIWALLNRYSFFGLMNGLMGSVLPEQYLKFGKPNKIFECFGSFMNHTSKYYCGLFYDLEKYVGCVGNFFDTRFKSGLFFVNPPFTVAAINKTVKRLAKLINAYDKTTFLLIIPTWRTQDRYILNNVCHTQLKTDYETDVNLLPILNNKKLIRRFLYCKGNFKYYDFITEKNISFASTDLILAGKKINYNLVDIFKKPDIVVV